MEAANKRQYVNPSSSEMEQDEIVLPSSSLFFNLLLSVYVATNCALKVLVFMSICNSVVKLVYHLAKMCLMPFSYHTCFHPKKHFQPLCLLLASRTKMHWLFTMGKDFIVQPEFGGLVAPTEQSGAHKIGCCHKLLGIYYRLPCI